MKSSKLKSIVSEAVLHVLNEADTAHEYAVGKAVGLRDKLAGKKPQRFNPAHYPAAFINGYNEIQSEGWWQKFNAKITDYLARLGSSRIRS